MREMAREIALQCACNLQSLDSSAMSSDEQAVHGDAVYKDGDYDDYDDCGEGDYD